MTTEMFGTPVGALAAQEYMQRAAQTADVQAMTQLRRMGIGEKGADLTLQQQFMQEAAGREGQVLSPDDMIYQLDRMAQVAMSAGRPGKAADFSSKSAALSLRLSQQDGVDMLTRNRIATHGKKKLELLGQVFNGVTDQASMDRAGALYSILAEEPNIYEGVPYSPELVEKIKSQAMTVKDRADTLTREANQRSLDAHRRRATKFLDERAEHLREVRRQKEANAKVSGKFGTRSLGDPKKDEIDAALVLLDKQYPKTPEEEKMNLAISMATRARYLRKANPGMDAAGMNAALVQAMGELNLQEPIGLLDQMYGMAKGAKGKSKSAVGIPKEQLVVGESYETAKGIGIWRGDGFELVGEGEE